jgi:hypothetical protein
MLLPKRNCKLIVGVLNWFKHYLSVVLREMNVIVAVHMADTSVLLGFRPCGCSTDFPIWIAFCVSDNVTML